MRRRRLIPALATIATEIPSMAKHGSGPFVWHNAFFAQRRTLLLFDEVEDVFADGDSGRKSTAQQRKAWMNRTLEDNSVPTIWISNSRVLDPAFIRRFDMVFELPIPPRSQRERIARKACLDLLTESSIARISESEALAPALITRASSVVGSIRHELHKLEIAPAIEFLVSSTPYLRKSGG
jgi:transitional endoplasmic reticulum ATPase